MAATLAQLVDVRSQLAEAILDYLTRLADKLDQTQWSRGGEWIKAGEIAVEQFVLTRKRLRPSRSEKEREGGDVFIEKRSPMDEIDAARYELPTNVEEREEERWRRVIQGALIRLGLRGAPGSGKTFTTRETIARLAREMARKLDAQQISLADVEVFIWITASALAKARGENIADAVLDAMETYLQLPLAPRLREWLQQAIHSSRAFIVVDALDELGTEDEASFKARSQQLDALPARLIVTCRTMQWETRKDWLGWRSVTEVELSPFKQRQQREFAGKFFQGATDLATSMQRLLQVNYSLRHACTTPLLLTFACWLHERGLVNDGTSYAELYGHMAREMVAGNWRNVKPIWSGSAPRVENCLLFLDEVAWRLFASAPEQNFFTLPAA